jgi:hypothetical protein
MFAASESFRDTDADYISNYRMCKDFLWLGRCEKFLGNLGGIKALADAGYKRRYPRPYCFHLPEAHRAFNKRLSGVQTLSGAFFYIFPE